jgi:hypothetical protein
LDLVKKEVGAVGARRGIQAVEGLERPGEDVDADMCPSCNETNGRIYTFTEETSANL